MTHFKAFPARVAPLIDRSSIESSPSLLLKADQPATITVRVSGTPAPKVSWYIGSLLLYVDSGGSRIKTSAGGDGLQLVPCYRHCLPIDCVTDELEQGLTVVAKNDAGQDCVTISIKTYKVLTGLSAGNSHTALYKRRLPSSRSGSFIMSQIRPTDQLSLCSEDLVNWQKEMEERSRMRSIDDIIDSTESDNLSADNIPAGSQLAVNAVSTGTLHTDIAPQPQYPYQPRTSTNASATVTTTSTVSTVPPDRTICTVPLQYQPQYTTLPNTVASLTSPQIDSVTDALWELFGIKLSSLCQQLLLTEPANDTVTATDTVTAAGVTTTSVTATATVGGGKLCRQTALDTLELTETAPYHWTPAVCTTATSLSSVTLTNKHMDPKPITATVARHDVIAAGLRDNKRPQVPAKPQVPPKPHLASGVVRGDVGGRGGTGARVGVEGSVPRKSVASGGGKGDKPPIGPKPLLSPTSPPVALRSMSPNSQLKRHSDTGLLTTTTTIAAATTTTMSTSPTIGIIRNNPPAGPCLKRYSDTALPPSQSTSLQQQPVTGSMSRAAGTSLRSADGTQQLQQQQRHTATVSPSVESAYSCGTQSPTECHTQPGPPTLHHTQTDGRPPTVTSPRSVHRPPITTATSSCGSGKTGSKPCGSEADRQHVSRPAERTNQPSILRTSRSEELLLKVGGLRHRSMSPAGSPTPVPRSVRGNSVDLTADFSDATSTSTISRKTLSKEWELVTWTTHEEIVFVSKPNDDSRPLATATQSKPPTQPRPPVELSTPPRPHTQNGRQDYKPTVTQCSQTIAACAKNSSPMSVSSNASQLDELINSLMEIAVQVESVDGSLICNNNNTISSLDRC